LQGTSKNVFLHDFTQNPILTMLNYFVLDIPAAVEVKGPDGFAFLIAVMILLIFPASYFILFLFRRNKSKTTGKNSFWSKKRIEVQLSKDRKFYPDYIGIRVRNTGNQDVDLAQPLLIFRNFWSKRKFKLKGTNRYSFYPLLLEPGKIHDLKIDLNHFYRHDKRLKKYPRVTFLFSDVSGKQFAPKSIMLRKTLFR